MGFGLVVMATDAQIPPGIGQELVWKRGPFGIVTGETGDRLAGARIPHLVSHGMAEHALGFMALAAYGVAVRA